MGDIIVQAEGITAQDTYTRIVHQKIPTGIKTVIVGVENIGDTNALLYKITTGFKTDNTDYDVDVEDVSVAAESKSDQEVSSSWVWVDVWVKNSTPGSATTFNVYVSGA
jgi:hypothetical protein